jgi:hypothetical protein
VWTNSGQTGGSENVTISGSNKVDDNDIAQNVTTTSTPSSGLVRWCYKVNAWSNPGTNNLTIYLRSPGGTGLGTQIDTVALTGTTGWLCRNANIPGGVMNGSGTYQFLARAHLETTGGGGTKEVGIFWDDFELNFTSPSTYNMNVTHSSTATISVPAAHSLVRVEAHDKFKSTSTLPTYTIEWFYNSAWTTSGCKVTSTISSEVDWNCTDASNPALAISASTIKIRLSSNLIFTNFNTSENYVWYKIWYPNITSSTISPSSDPSPTTGNTFQVSCNGSVDSDFSITNAEFRLQWRPAAGSWSDMTTSGLNGLYLNGSTPTNPYTSVSISAGGTTTQSWTVVANTAGSYEVRCFVNSSSAGNATSTTTVVTVTGVAAVQWIDTDKASYDSCGTLFYRVSLFDQSGAPTDSSLNVQILNTTAVVMSQINTATTAGVYYGIYLFPTAVDWGAWTIKVVAQNLLLQQSFSVGAGDRLWKINITFSPDSVRYNTGTAVQMKITVLNEFGERVSGLLPSSITAKIDTTDITASLTETNSEYYYNYVAVAGEHTLFVNATTLSSNASASRGFVVR